LFGENADSAEDNEPASIQRVRVRRIIELDVFNVELILRAERRINSQDWIWRMELYWIYPVLFLASLMAGFVDAIAGGGGLLAVPALLACGLPPQVVLGTNKFQSTFGTALAAWNYMRAGLMNTPGLWFAVAAGLCSSIVGALIAIRLDPTLLRRVIPFLLLGIASYLALNRNLGMNKRPPRLEPHLFAILFGSLLGFYDGFFGPGTGSFWMAACVIVLGLDMRAATGYTKAANLASNVAALVTFVFNGHVHYGIGLLMATGNLIGARLGSRMVIHRGAALVRPIFLTVVIALSFKLFWDAFHPR
jgi:uncharacterized membrane protein YfcA